MSLPAMPRRSALLTDLRQWLVSRDWDKWFDLLARSVDATAQQLGLPLDLTLQGVGSPTSTTVLTVPTTRLYRVSYYVRITRAATTSSSLTVAFGWTDDGTGAGDIFPALTANVVGAFQTLVFLVHADAGTDITYQTVYASVGATSMQYRASVRVEAVP